MSTPKPRIKPKADPHRERSESPLHDAPTFSERDPPVFRERDPAQERKPAERIVFHENDCLG